MPKARILYLAVLMYTWTVRLVLAMEWNAFLGWSSHSHVCKLAVCAVHARVYSASDRVSACVWAISSCFWPLSLRQCRFRFTPPRNHEWTCCTKKEPIGKQVTTRFGTLPVSRSTGPWAWELQYSFVVFFLVFVLSWIPFSPPIRMSARMRWKISVWRWNEGTASNIPTASIVLPVFVSILQVLAAVR